MYLKDIPQYHHTKACHCSCHFCNSLSKLVIFSSLSLLVYNCKATIAVYTYILSHDACVNSTVENAFFESLYLLAYAYLSN